MTTSLSDQPQDRDPSAQNRPGEQEIQEPNQLLATRKKGKPKPPYEFTGIEAHKGLMALITEIIQKFTGGN